MKDIKSILDELIDAHPHRSTGKPYIKRAKKWSLIMLILSGISIVFEAMSGWWYQVEHAQVLAYFALIFYGLAILLALSGLLVEPITIFHMMRRWKVETMDTFIHEVENDEAHVKRLEKYEIKSLEQVRAFLQIKVKRIERQIGLFFGGNVAVFSLIALVQSNIKDAGGLSWLRSTIQHGISSGNIANTVLLWGIAFIFGVSIGAIALKCVQGRYAYLLELVELTLMRK